MSCKDQGTEFEFTVVQKFNQGSFPKSACPDERSDFGRGIPARPVRRGFRGSFFVSFLEKQKRKTTTIRIISKIHCCF